MVEEKRDQEGGLGKYRWSGLEMADIVLIVAAATLVIVFFPPQVENPVERFPVPELAGNPPPVSVVGGFTFNSGAKKVNFDSFDDQHPPTIKVIEVKSEKVNVVLARTEECGDCREGETTFFARRTIKSAGSFQSMKDHKWFADGTITVKVIRDKGDVSLYFTIVVVGTGVVLMFFTALWLYTFDRLYGLV